MDMSPALIGARRWQRWEETRCLRARGREPQYLPAQRRALCSGNAPIRFNDVKQRCDPAECRWASDARPGRVLLARLNPQGLASQIQCRLIVSAAART
jgi:hypothetical protein